MSEKEIPKSYNRAFKFKEQCSNCNNGKCKFTLSYRENCPLHQKENHCCPCIDVPPQDELTCKYFVKKVL